ncbi:MAG: hypothetical protein ACP5P4_05100 [Steroidobacteraceae bacterium]
MNSRQSTIDKDDEVVGMGEVPLALRGITPERAHLPWWATVVIAVGLAEVAWFGKTIVAGSQQSAVTATEIKQLQQGLATTEATLTTIDADMQTISVQLAVLTQQVKDRNNDHPGRGRS